MPYGVFKIMRKASRFLGNHAAPFSDKAGWALIETIPQHARGIRMPVAELTRLLKNYPNTDHVEAEGNYARCFCGHSEKMESVLVDRCLGFLLGQDSFQSLHYPRAHYGAYFGNLKDNLQSGLFAGNRLHLHLMVDRRYMPKKYEVAIQVDVPAAMKRGANFITAGPWGCMILTRGVNGGGRLPLSRLGKVMDTEDWEPVTGTLDELLAIKPLRALPKRGAKQYTASNLVSPVNCRHIDDEISLGPRASNGTTLSGMTDREDYEKDRCDSGSFQSTDGITATCPFCKGTFTGAIETCDARIKLQDGGKVTASFTGG